MTLGAEALTGACRDCGVERVNIREMREREMRASAKSSNPSSTHPEQLSETMMAAPPDICDGRSAYLTRTRGPALGTGPSSPSVTLAPGSQKRREQKAQQTCHKKYAQHLFMFELLLVLLFLSRPFSNSRVVPQISMGILNMIYSGNCQRLFHKLQQRSP